MRFNCFLLPALTLCLSGLLLMNSLIWSPLARSDAMLPQQEAHGVAYVTGGIGEEEIDALAAYQRQYRLTLVFTEGKIGRAIDDVAVTIFNAEQQTVFSLAHAAPRLLLNLPAGNYTIMVTHLNEALRWPLRWKDQQPQRIILNWPRAVEEDEKDRQHSQAPTPHKRWHAAGQRAFNNVHLDTHLDSPISDQVQLFGFLSKS